VNGVSSGALLATSNAPPDDKKADLVIGLSLYCPAVIHV